MRRNTEWILVGVGLLVAAASCAMLVDSWWSWTGGPWADCPNYAFGKSWYPEPPLIVTFIPCAASLATTTLFSVLLVRFIRERRSFAAVIAVAGLVGAVLPLLAVIVLPIISNALGMTTAGC